MSEKEVKLSNEERMENLRKQLEEVTMKREQLVAELNALNTISLKIQGALEVLESMKENEEEVN